MGNILRPKKSIRNFSILGLIFFGGFLIASSFLCLAEGLVIIFGFLCGLYGFLLLSYYRESLLVDDDRIVQTGFFRRREIALVDLSRARWQIASAGGSVVLCSSAEKIKVEFNNFEGEQRRWLIRRLRRTLPQTLQQDWDRFCMRIALPLLKHDIDEPLRPDEILITRRRYDRLFLVVTAALAFVGVYCAWLLHDLRCLKAPLAALLPWLFLRFQTPKKGIRDKNLFASENRFFLYVFGSGYLFLVLLSVVLKYHSGLAIGLAIVWFTIFLVVVSRMDQRRRAAQDLGIPAAVEEWDRLIGSDKECEAKGFPISRSTVDRGNE